MNQLRLAMAHAKGRVVDRYRLKKMIERSSLKRIVIGASGAYDPGWIPTDIQLLNLLRPADWERFFKPESIDAMLAEHVWEHLTYHDGKAAAETCLRYLKRHAYLRLAVPDGLHPDPDYIQSVRPGGTGAGADDHKTLYTYRTMKALFEDAGFRVCLYEYFDEHGNFHYQDWNSVDGKIQRSSRFDERNRGGNLAYTSIVMDAFK